MAEWQNIDSFKVTYKGEERSKYKHDASNAVFITLQYDNASVTAEQVTLRFVYTASYGLSDTFDILLNPNDNTSWQLFHIKTTNDYKKGPFYSDSFVIKKHYTYYSFSLPEFWICNLGYDRKMNTPADCYRNYNYSDWLGQVLRTTYSGGSLSILPGESVAEEGEAPYITGFNDRLNNTVRITGRVSEENSYVNNPLESSTLYYTIDGSDPASSSTRKYYSSKSNISSIGTYIGTFPGKCGESFSKDLVIENVNKTCTVRVHLVNKFKYNVGVIDKSLSDVKYYLAPSKPGEPILYYNKSRLTVKEPWKFEWSKANANDKSYTGVVGYYIMLRHCPAGKDPTVVSNWDYVRGRMTCNTDNSIDVALDGNTDNSTNYFAKRSNTSCTAIYNDPTELNIKPGDSIKLRIKSFTVNGAGETLQGDELNYRESDIYTVENAGVVNVKVGNDWVEGQVYVKVNNEWKEAETVNIKVGNEWKESQ